MGNDGGSIPDRRDLVRTKRKAEQADKQNQSRAQWFFCALSKKPLQKPIVADELGKMYNKDSLVEYLLDHSAYGDGLQICGHIRSLKDVRTLELTSNPLPLPTGSDLPFAPFVCPLTGKEMLGVIPFVVLWSCGCVFSRSGLRALATPVEGGKGSDDSRGSGSGSGSGSEKENENEKDTKDSEKETEKEAQTEKPLACPQCGKPYLSSQIIPLNPPPSESAHLLSLLLARRASEPKSKKRKLPPSSGEPESKKPKAKAKATKPVPVQGPSVASNAVAHLLKEEEKKRLKNGMSEAVKSLYKPDSGREKETFLTMGTFTRVSA
ncbi:DUF602-domain-containing protein [Dacryopinax primogenitus]|uniref:DUF602-domain-containing protein n=1 Tax=Dacryopinax primogenitus (strain DJM 731) TaxID=1858805 RepID=M5FUC8_DACPD|nr:DUF602-domain-containing protein [Dacryopinax primogenitus]EJT99084.1 DUF602-domain-containing protein [Dacryopinax primogenitus]